MNIEFWPLRPKCDERGCDCHPHESEEDFEQWQVNGMCRTCNELISVAERLEFR